MLPLARKVRIFNPLLTLYDFNFFFILANNNLLAV